LPLSEDKVKALRIFYNQNSEIIWTHGLEGTGVFPTTAEDDLKALPVGTQCLEITDPELIRAFNASSTNTIQDGKLIIGKPDPIIPPEPIRDLEAELDDLKAWAKTVGYTEKAV
jgi:hypothetical protein